MLPTHPTPWLPCSPWPRSPLHQAAPPAPDQPDESIPRTKILCAALHPPLLRAVYTAATPAAGTLLSDSAAPAALARPNAWSGCAHKNRWPDRLAAHGADKGAPAKSAAAPPASACPKNDDGSLSSALPNQQRKTPLLVAIAANSS